jgi:tetraacyldisaccharide 4'-kinase
MIEKIWLTIIGSKGNPLFWPLLAILWLFSIFYRLGLRLRSSAKSQIKLTVPVISAGNITIGGSGKTPVVYEIVRHLQKNNKRVGIVSSGYGRKSSQYISGLGSDLAQMSVDNIGDEILMLSESLPDTYFSIGSSKAEAAVLLESKYKPDIIIVDDAFQHRKLYRNLDILLIDAGADLRSESLFPLGKLREPLREINRCHQILITKVNLNTAGDNFRKWLIDNFSAKRPVDIRFENRALISRTDKISIDTASASNVYFFAGIGQFAPLLNHIKMLFPNLKGFRFFPDHCPYRQNHLEQLRRDIKKMTPDFVITTRKDYVKLRGFDFGQPIYYLDLELEFENGVPFWSKIDSIAEGH